MITKSPLKYTESDNQPMERSLLLFENSVDNCPLIANANQLDSDSDGVGDLCDVQNEPIFQQIISQIQNILASILGLDNRVTELEDKVTNLEKTIEQLERRLTGPPDGRGKP